MVHERWSIYDIMYVQRMFVEVCNVCLWKYGSRRNGARRTPGVWSKITDRGSRDVDQRSRRHQKQTHTIGRHRLEHGMSSFSECSMTSFVKSFSDVIPYISRC